MSEQQQQQLVTVTIDGRTLQVAKGSLLVEAVKQVQDIPVFCYHSKLDPAGVCRMCLVQIEKIPKPQAACTTPVADGMVVHTQNETVDNLRKGALEFLLLNHPLDCPVCDKGGECDLQDLTVGYGNGTSRLQDPKIHKNKAQDLGNFIVLDNERCILCRRCVRFDNEIATEGNLIIEERAHFNTVTTMAGHDYNSYFSGNTIEICPVGALTSETYRFKARPWDLSKVDSICHGCSVGCETQEHFRHGELLRINGRDVDDASVGPDAGWLCDRGRFNYRFVHSDARITKPLIKQDGQFVEATWGQAIAAIAEKFKAVKATSGGKGFGVIGGGKLTNEEAYLLQKFARVALGTNNVDHRVTDQVIASLGGFAARQSDLSNTGMILVLDTDPVEIAPVMDLRIRRAADRKKAKIAVIGSVMPKYRGRHARVQLKPGQVPAAVSALAALVAGKEASASAANAESLKLLAGLLNGANKITVVWGGNDAATGRALLELCNALKGSHNVGVLIPGAQNNSRGAEAMGVLPGYLPGYAAIVDSKSREAVGNVWNVRNLSAEAGLTTEGMLNAAANGEIKALYVAGVNLLSTFPNRQLAEKALENAFVVTTELFLNESAQLADVVLPASSISEKTGTFTTLDGLVQSIKQSKKAAGVCQPDGDILVGLAAALGTKLSGSPAETSWEIAKLAAKLDNGVVLNGAPASMVPAAAATETPEGLVLVPITKLYAGTSTAKFDTEFNHVQPKAEAFFNPADALKLGITDGEQVELTANGQAIRLTAKVEKSVVAGTVQAIKSLSEAPVNLLTAGTAPVAVTVAKLAVEVAD